MRPNSPFKKRNKLMAKLYLLDPSLRGAVGHHLQYSRLVMQSAESRGLECVLATHRDFRDRTIEDQLGRVQKIYSHAIYDDPLMTLDVGCAAWLDRLSTTLSDCASQWDVVRRHQRRRAIAKQFGQATEGLFQQSPLEHGDHVFLPAASELSMLGLGKVIDRIANSDQVTWHLLFHFDYLLGRPAEWPRQKQRIRRMRRALQCLRRGLRGQRLHFYTTTDQLTEQYNLLDPGAFHTLEYPIDPSVPAGGDHRQPVAPLRVTFAGDARIAKGFQHLPEIIRPLSDDLIPSRQIQFDLQANFSFRLPCRRRDMPLVHSRRALQEIVDDQASLRLDALSTDDYRKLILDADICLLPYDAEHYHTRCSGVVVEMLSAAVPIIVPPGCWMADQIGEAIAEHQQAMRKTLDVVESLSLGQVHCSRRLQTPEAIHGDALKFSTGRHAAAWQLVPPSDATHLAIEFHPSKSTPPGTSVRIEWKSVGALTPPGEQQSVVVPAVALRRSIAMLRVDSRAKGLRLRWENAFGKRSISVNDVRFDFLSARQLATGDGPLGAVGVIADGPAGMSRAVREIVRFYPHYRETAREFSKQWNVAHHPDRVIDEFLMRASGETRVDGAHQGGPSRRRTYGIRRAG